MKKEYKEIIVNYLYDIIQGNAESTVKGVKRRFKERFGFEPDFTIIETNKVIPYDELPGGQIWVGKMVATLVVDGETFICERDWYDEYVNERIVDPTGEKRDEYEGKYESMGVYAYTKYEKLLDQIKGGEI